MILGSDIDSGARYTERAFIQKSSFTNHVVDERAITHCKNESHVGDCRKLVQSEASENHSQSLSQIIKQKRSSTPPLNMSPAGEAQRTSSQTAKSSAFNATQGPARCTPRASKRRDQPVRPGNSPAPPTKKQAAPASPDRSDSSDTHSAGAHAASRRRRPTVRRRHAVVGAKARLELGLAVAAQRPARVKESKSPSKRRTSVRHLPSLASLWRTSTQAPPFIAAATPCEGSDGPNSA